MTIYAHTKENCGEVTWELLYGANGHAERTATIAREWSRVFKYRLKDADVWLRALGLYHDMGKAQCDFQRYLRGECSSVSHKKDAAAFFYSKRDVCGKLIAYAFDGHHSGLADGCLLFNAALSGYNLSPEVMAAMPQEMRLVPFLQRPEFKDVGTPEELSVALTMFVRMLHSCLVDADWLATEEYMQPVQTMKRQQRGYASLTELSRRLEVFICNHENRSVGYINSLRRQIHERCYAAADCKPGVCRLNVPTGGGKTLSSLSYALKHAEVNDLDRVIYVIPYTSIIEQTSGEFRVVLGEENVVEHHASLTEESDTEHNRFGSENWDAPVIVTTTMQFFESLYSSRNKRCRKIHNIARSVIVLDEVQSLPPAMLSPCLAVLRELQRGYGCSILLCTATQPSFENRGLFTIGWKPGEIRSLLGQSFESMLASRMKRVHVSRLGKITQRKLVEHFLQQSKHSALFIVNLTRQAQELFKLLRNMGIDNIFHLSARMCPAHRRLVLENVKGRLMAAEPVVLVSTRVVEAGVDISFPVVYRDCCGLDSLAQSAGRCNRHGEAEVGQVFLYGAEEQEFVLPSTLVDMKNAVYALDDVLKTSETIDITSSELIESYYRAYYARLEGGNMWDARGVIEKCVEGMRAGFEWDFKQIAEDFRMIEDAGRTLLVPFCEDVENLRKEFLTCQKLGVMPTRDMYRRLQQYSVIVYEYEWNKLVKDCVHQSAEVYMLDEEGLYDGEIGLLRCSDEEKTYIL